MRFWVPYTPFEYVNYSKHANFVQGNARTNQKLYRTIHLIRVNRFWTPANPIALLILIKDYKIGFCCFSAKYAAWRRKSTDWCARNRDNVFEWGNMSNRGLLFQWASIIEKNPTKRVDLVQSRPHRFRAHQSVLFLLHAAYLAEKQQKPIL
jgi:hypothetical protein